MKCPDFESRLDVAVATLVSANIIADANASDLKSAARAFFSRCKMADSYKPGAQLKSAAVMLVRASQTSKEAERLGADYGLHEVCAAPVAVHVVDGTHETFIVGNSAAKVARLINEQLKLGGKQQ